MNISENFSSHSFPLFNKYIISHAPISQHRKRIIYIYITKIQSSKTNMFKFSKKFMREDLKLTWCKIAICAYDCCLVRWIRLQELCSAKIKDTSFKVRAQQNMLARDVNVNYRWNTIMMHIRQSIGHTFNDSYPSFPV